MGNLTQEDFRSIGWSAWEGPKEKDPSGLTPKKRRIYCELNEEDLAEVLDNLPPDQDEEEEEKW